MGIVSEDEAPNALILRPDGGMSLRTNELDEAEELRDTIRKKRDETRQ